MNKKEIIKNRCFSMYNNEGAGLNKTVLWAYNEGLRDGNNEMPVNFVKYLFNNSYKVWGTYYWRKEGENQTYTTEQVFEKFQKDNNG